MPSGAGGEMAGRGVVAAYTDDVCGWAVCAAMVVSRASSSKLAGATHAGQASSSSPPPPRAAALARCSRPTALAADLRSASTALNIDAPKPPCAAHPRASRLSYDAIAPIAGNVSPCSSLPRRLAASARPLTSLFVSFRFTAYKARLPRRALQRLQRGTLSNADPQTLR